MRANFTAAASPMTDSARWLLELLTGPAATIVAIIAVATIGFALLQGRIDLRRGASIVLGIFIVFGAPAIAEALLAITQPSGAAWPVASPAPIIPDLATAQSGSSQSVYDPYAGAALPDQR
jgi:type IV secretion system protein VirB2